MFLRHLKVHHQSTYNDKKFLVFDEDFDSNKTAHWWTTLFISSIILIAFLSKLELDLFICEQPQIFKDLASNWEPHKFGDAIFKTIFWTITSLITLIVLMVVFSPCSIKLVEYCAKKSNASLENKQKRGRRISTNKHVLELDEVIDHVDNLAKLRVSKKAKSVDFSIIKNKDEAQTMNVSF